MSLISSCTSSSTSGLSAYSILVRAHTLSAIPRPPPSILLGALALEGTPGKLAVIGSLVIGLKLGSIWSRLAEPRSHPSSSLVRHWGRGYR
ncbi:hypothetical protein FOMPIDRAFT_1025165 [Fomitopsis schrenkii]|uniref:Uncharacterized protein n=1 Tax=Fomitopsis schrenkii TaxID=2126942 RepID=S8E0T9_FOMSC|nr:hypothetical protein FOMPIDRAFT_1025165 [Fomitopsis schrenkii]